MTKNKSKVVLALAIICLIASCTSTVTSSSNSSSNNSSSVQDSGNNQSISPITNSTLADEWTAINDDAGYNPNLVLNNDDIGTLDFYNVDYYMNSSLTLEWQNDNTNIITKIK